MPYAPRVKSVTPPESKLFLSTTEVGQLLGLGPISVSRKIRAGEIKASFIGRGWLVKRSDLDRYVESQSRHVAKIAA